MAGEARVAVNAAEDVLIARQYGRRLAARLGFSGSEITLIAAAISEIARNIVEHADCGELSFAVVERGSKRGLRVVSRDQGPGIRDVRQAMQLGYSSGAGAGLGLPGARWLMDDFRIESKPGEGTVITMTKWTSGPTPPAA